MKHFLTNYAKGKIKEFCTGEIESCGFILSSKRGLKVVKCENKSDNPKERFMIGFEETEYYKSLGNIVGCFHDHLDNSTEFSKLDKWASEKTGVPYILYSNNEFFFYLPKGRDIPYVGRPYAPGVFDCFSLTKDFYKNEFNIELPEFYHELRYVEDWRKHISTVKKYKGSRDETIVERYFLENNFKEVKDFKKGDILLLHNGLAVADLAIFTKGNNILLQEFDESMYSYIDSKIKSRLKKTLRHRSLC
tara:strand:- start:9825 stop:10568 length:744 start_codon:yes stop_codon:yes gene_type:complete